MRAYEGPSACDYHVMFYISVFIDNDNIDVTLRLQSSLDFYEKYDKFLMGAAK